MPYPIQWLLSLIFIVQMYLSMALIALAFAPLAAIDRKYAFTAVHLFSRWVRISAQVLVGLKSEIRGDIPQGEVLIASKHQSFFDIILIVSAVPRPKFIMKKQLSYFPIVGFYAKRIGCVAVDRGKRGQAIKKMVADVNASGVRPGQLIIFPQGTRVAAGASLPYKVGTGVLYDKTGQTCVPAATNVGVFWRRHGIYRGRGTAVVEFLPPIEPGMKLHDFMSKLEDTIETASNALMAEAGFTLSSE